LISSAVSAALFVLWLFNNEPRLNYRCLDTIKSDRVCTIIDYT